MNTMTKPSTLTKKTFALVGTGGRSPIFLDPIAGLYRDSCQLVGICDTSPTRRRFHQQRLSQEYQIGPVPDYGDFDLMLRETRPEVVMVCTPDYLHHEFIVKSLESGADVISEKPLTIDAGKCRQIFEAVQKSGRTVRTIFNMRWSPGVGKVRELIAGGAIGRVRHINFEYMLNTSHGADYFRRWHSRKEFSGGLLLHKATHHFDLLNWWMNAIPSTVSALGDLVFYGKKNALARGDAPLTKYPRYTGVAEAENDPFRLDLGADPTMRALYQNAEADSGYIRDQNVFREDIDIEDSMSLLIKYRTGEMVSYSLNAYCPEEGFRAAISGDKGRIVYTEKHGSHIITGASKIIHGDEEATVHLQLQKHFSEPCLVDVPKAEGGHGGGDPLIQEQMFSPHPPADPLKRSAGHEQGAASLLIGAAGNLSMITGQPVSLDDLLPLPPQATQLTDLV